MKIGRYRCQLVRENATEYPARKIGSINSTIKARQAVEILAADLVNCPQEQFWIVTLDTKLKPINTHEITVGTLDSSLVHPREVFRAAVMDSASSILLIHNHPSGDLKPSPQDREVTDRLKRAGDIVGIQVIDHIIVGWNDDTDSIHSVSLAETV